MLRRFMGEQYFCGLDLGSQSIKASVIKGRRNHALGLLGVHEVKTSGFQKASVTDLGELSECIHTVLGGLAKKTGIKLKEVQLGIGGELIERRFSSAVIPLGDRGSKVITLRAVKKIQLQARLLGVNMEETVLHDFPRYYQVDDVRTALNPLGLYGRKLAVKSLLIVSDNTLLRNLTKAVNQSGYDVANLFFTSLSSTDVSLNEYQKRQGCVFIDIGATVTNVLIFKKGQLEQFINIPLGGEHVTRGIADKLGLAFDLAEDIKKSHALVHLNSRYSDKIEADKKGQGHTPIEKDRGTGRQAGEDIRRHEDILIKREGGYLPIKRKEISQAVEPVITTFINAIIEAVKASDIHDSMKPSQFPEAINAGIVMGGGGALLPGLPERIAKATNLPVKMGKVNMEVRRLRNAAKYFSAVGLARRGWQEAFGLIPNPNGHDGKTSIIVNKIRELYQEYF